MSGNGNTKRFKSRFIGFAFLLVIVVIVIIIGVSLFLGDLSPLRLSDLFSRKIPPITVNEFNFDIGRARAFANLDGSIAAAGTQGVKVLDAGGTLTLREPFRLSEPVITASASRCIAYDLGGNAVRVFNKTEVLSVIETDNAIVSASLNHNGWYCLVTQGSGGYKSAVTVYNSANTNVYGVNLVTGFALSAQLSYDNKNLAILSLAETGSRIIFYHDIDTQEDPAFVFEFDDGLIIDIIYLKNGDLLAVSTKSLIIIDSFGSNNVLYDFEGKRLGGYTFNGELIALHLYDYGVGHRGRLVTLLLNGTVLGELIMDREIISMSSVNDSLILLRNDGVSFFNKELEEFGLSADSLSAAGASRVLAVREDTALAVSDNSAVIIRREETVK